MTSLIKRGRKWNANCSLYNKPETVNIIIFGCPLAQYVWSCLRDALGWEGFPTSVKDLTSNWITKGFRTSQSLGMFFFAGLAWAIWRNRNKVAIEKSFPATPNIVIYAGTNFLHTWENDQRAIVGVGCCGSVRRS